jgi:hypothetical protein
MDVGSFVLSVLLFVAFVPGVLVRLPAKGSAGTVLVVHAALFAVAASAVMTLYWRMREGFGNYGPTCPNGYTKTEGGDCVPSGHQTYDV